MSVGKVIGRKLRWARAGESALFSRALERLPESIVVTSPAVAAFATIPARYTIDGAGDLLPLAWSGAPAETVAYAIVVEDPDAPIPVPFFHAFVYGISAETTRFDHADFVAARARSLTAPGPRTGRHLVGGRDYIAPAPIPGHGVHHYHYEVFALARPLAFAGVPSRKPALAALEDAAIARGELIASYER